MTYTQGTWLAIKQDHENTSIQNEDGDPVCILKNKYHKLEDLDLLCAAPDMLGVLLRAEYLFTSIDGTTIENEKLYDDYKSAIAKATGETK